VREAEPRSASLRRITLALAASVLCAYGYGQEQDPFIGAWKLVAAQANQGHWDEARADSRALDPGLTEVENGFGWPLRAPIADALAARDARALARELTIAACGELLWKVDASRRAGLADYYVAKYRVEAARTFYTELLAPAVRHQDATRSESVHERIWNGLDRAQSALGRPGFLGRGVVPPDVQAYSQAELEVEAALRAAFPFVPEVKR
jgi:hypothetical protein